jgi:HAD superfamily hydrolase (TIGR01509 family)
MNLKTIILDFDGTMGDTQALIVNTMFATIDELHLEKRSRQQCASMIGLPLKQTFTDLIPMTEEMGERCVEVYTRLFFQHNKPGAVPMFPHVRETIEALHQRGKVITIASSRKRKSLVGFLHDMNLEQYIPYIISADDVEHAKPAPDMVIKTLNDLHAVPEETLVVGDTVFDIKMGKGAGAVTCGVTYGNGTRRQMEEEGTDFIIDDFGKLMEIVD